MPKVPQWTEEMYVMCMKYAWVIRLDRPFKCLLHHFPLETRNCLRVADEWLQRLALKDDVNYSHYKKENDGCRGSFLCVNFLS